MLASAQGQTWGKIQSTINGAATALVLALCSATPAQAETFKVGVVPQFEPQMLAEIWMPILDELGRRTGHDFVMVGSPRIPEFEVSFLEGEFDFAYMNPFHYLKAADSQRYRPLVRDGDRQLFGVLVVAADAPFDDVADLDGELIAFPSPNALGAALLMRADLERIHGISYEARYVATHSSAYLNVALGEAQAAGGVMATFNRIDPAIRERLRIIYETTRLPPHPFVAHSRVEDSVAEDVRQAFIDMADSDEGQALLQRVPFLNPVAAAVEEYDMLRELNLEDFWVEN
jgi:phosphonate transport system substrate-binding protein